MFKIHACASIFDNFEFELLSPDSSAMLCCESVLHVGILHDQTNSFMIRVFDSLFSLIFLIYVSFIEVTWVEPFFDDDF